MDEVHQETCEQNMLPEIAALIQRAGKSGVARARQELKIDDSRQLTVPFESFTRIYRGRRPVTDILREMQAATEEAAATPGDIPPWLEDQWDEAIRTNAAVESEQHFRKAREQSQDSSTSCGHIRAAVNCQLALTGWYRHWNHATQEDLDEVLRLTAADARPPQLGEHLLTAWENHRRITGRTDGDTEEAERTARIVIDLLTRASGIIA